LVEEANDGVCRLNFISRKLPDKNILQLKLPKQRKANRAPLD
jgi:hypothetical protein